MQSRQQIAQSIDICSGKDVRNAAAEAGEKRGQLLVGAEQAYQEKLHKVVSSVGINVNPEKTSPYLCAIQNPRNSATIDIA